MQNEIERDLKAALLSGDKKRVETLRVIKSAILYEAVAQNVRDKGLDDEQVQKVLAKESKKRTEAADIYNNAGETERAQAELSEKEIIDKYLPAQLTEAEVAGLVKEEVTNFENPSPADMGKIIGAVLAKAGVSADGAMIARLVKEALERK